MKFLRHINVSPLVQTLFSVWDFNYLFVYIYSFLDHMNW